MKRYQRRMNLLGIVLGAAGLGLLAASFFLPPAAVSGGIALFVALCLVIHLLTRQTADICLRELAQHLSELVEQLAGLRHPPVFPELEDTLLSRLQQQVERLASVWAKQNAQAKQDRQEIQALVSDLSHQLKTPVATIRIYADFLSRAELPPARRQQYGARMGRALEQLDFLLDSMVKLSRLETGSIRLQTSCADPEELVLNAALQVRRAADEKQIRLAVRPADGCIQVLCDKKWTEEAIFNVLDNAVKYTPAGGRVSVEMQACETFVRIDITDTGRGIPPEEIPRIFLRFHRGENARDVDGAGLGLSLTRKILLEQGGWIKAASDGEGSRFSLFLRRC